MENYILTRYLYSFVEAEQSLFLCILKQDFEQALYWGYELYFSGFDEEMFEFCCKMAEEFYRKKVSMKKYIMSQKDKWLKNTENHILIGNSIALLCNNNPNIINFVKTYFGVNCKKEEENTIQTNNKYSMTDELLKPLFTFQDYSVFPYKVLKIVQKHSPVKHYRDLFRTIIPENSNEIRDGKWLYYASRSPIWYERIIQYKGIINEETEIISFENDDNLDEFYNHWGYEPDEQSKEIQYNMGLHCDTEQKDLTAFCNELHYRIPKITKKKAKKE
jgi:hypothetical protein